MDLKEMYDQELQQKQQDAFDEAAARAHLGCLIRDNTSVKTAYDWTIKLEASADAEDVLKQAVALVNPEVWRVDSYSITNYSRIVRPIKVKSGLREVEDKKHKACSISVNQTFIHQYYWHDQSMHLYESEHPVCYREVPKKVFGNYESDYKMMISEMEAPLKMAEKLARGSQKYIRIRYEPETYDGCWLDDNVLYLFSDGNAYTSKSDGPLFFNSAFNEKNLEKTSRFIVKQIMALNEK